MKNFINFLKGFPAPEEDDRLNIELRRKITVLNLFLLIGSFFTFILGIITFRSGNTFITAVDTLALLIFSSLFIYLRNNRNFERCATLSIFFVGLFFVFLFATGGIDKTSFVWVFPFPMIAIYLTGVKKGTYATLIMLFAMIIVFLTGSSIPQFANYEFNVKIRTIPAFILITLFSFTIEKMTLLVSNKLLSARKLREKNLHKLKQMDEENEKLIKELESKLGEVRSLQTILPICSICKKIRNDDGYWEKVEKYFHQHSGTVFSTSLCPECEKKPSKKPDN
ncbi:MAG: hypothetical protein ACQETH_08855 [Candidatus Rifleibacteriota bacterium]